MRSCIVVLFIAAGVNLARGAAAPSPFAVRGTLPWHNFLSGPTAWNEADYRAYLDAMQSAGLNYLALHCYTGGAERYATYVEPLIKIQYRNVVPEAGFDTSLTAHWGYRPLAVADFAFDTGQLFKLSPGARGFGADCAVLSQTREQRYACAQSLLRRVIRLAHARGIQVGLGFEFGIHPPEFSSIVPPDSWVRGAMLPDPTHPASIEILRATLDNLLEAYPELDWIWLWLHEHTMYVGKAQMGERFRQLMERSGPHFAGAGEAAAFTGVWSLAYIQLAHDYLGKRAPKLRLAISGWGGGAQLPDLLRGLDRALPKHIVFTCLNPDQGWSPQPAVLAEIAQHRQVWAIPWLEGDAQLWHLQPRASLLREQVRLAQQQGLRGVLAIHWRTAEARANFAAFARFAQDPAGAPTVEEFYRADCEARQGKEAASLLAPLLARLDAEQLAGAPSPEYFPYDPHWGRLKPEQRPRLQEVLRALDQATASTSDKTHRANLDWLRSKLQFTLLLDEVSRALEPAYQLKERWLRGEVEATGAAAAAESARQALQRAPVEALFRTYARQARSRGELGVLSSLNQKLWLQYKELQQFLAGLEAKGR